MYMHQERVPLLTTEWEFIGCVAIPGYSFIKTRWKKVGRMILTAWIASACVFILWLGYSPAEWSFGAMMSLHVSSVLHILNRATPEFGLLRRLVLSLIVLFVVGTCFYSVALRQVLLPLRIKDKVYVTHPIPKWATIHRGDLVAYRTFGSLGRVRIARGYLLDRVLAAPGDKVEFTESGCSVNGAAPVRLRWMPVDESLIVPEKTWLVWPTLDMLARANVADEEIAKSVFEIALVKRAQIVGKPFRRWFWREQTL
jgi:hypothetical protein